MRNGAAILFAFLPLLLWAQWDVKIDESSRSFSRGNYPSYQLELSKSHLKDVQNDWIGYISKGSKGKPVILNGEITMLLAANPNISPNPFNIYSTLLETTTGVKLTVWLTINNDSVFMSNAVGDRNLAVEKYLHDFAAKEYRVVVKAELDGENAKLKKMQNQLKTFFRDQEKATGKSNHFQRDIARNRDEIAVNENDQVNKQAQIAQQKQVVEERKSNPGPDLDAAQKTLRGYQSDLNKLINKKEKLYKQIDNWSAKINAQNRETNQALDNQKSKYAEIDKQKAVVDSVLKKLNGIQ